MILKLLTLFVIVLIEAKKKVITMGPLMKDCAINQEKVVLKEGCPLVNFTYMEKDCLREEVLRGQIHLYGGGLFQRICLKYQIYLYGRGLFQGRVLKVEGIYM